MKEQNHLLFLTIIGLIILGTLLWMMSIIGIIKGPWSSIPLLVFALLGAMLTLIQVLKSFETAPSSVTSKTSKKSQQHYYEEIDGIELRISKHRGALIVYTAKPLCGSTIHLYYGFHSVLPKADLASTVIGHKRKNRLVFTGHFPSLNPGNYTIHMDSPELVARVTIEPERVSEIDWRLRKP